VADDYAVVGSELAHLGRLSRVRVDRVRMPDSEVVEREVVEHPDAVAVVAIDADGAVVLLRQYRHPVGDLVLEIPAGKLDVEGEDPADAAARELQEETGLTAASLVELVTFHNSSGWTDERTTVYLAEGVTDGAVPDDFTPHAEEAAMEVVRLPLAEAVARAERGEIADAKTLVGLLLTAARRR
jgi:ADP-ribose pyrophosphatase